MKLTTELLSQTVRSTVANVCQAVGVNEANHTESLQRICNVYSSSFCLPDPFAGVKTQYMQQKHFTEHFGMVNPVLINLPEKSDAFGRVRTNQSQKIRKETYVTVPLISQLTILLNKNDVHRQVFGEKIHVPGVLSRFEDGSAFKDSFF